MTPQALLKTLRKRWPDALLLTLMLLPGVGILPQLFTPWVDEALFGDLMHETGEWAARLLIVTLLVAPLHSLWPRARFTKFLRKRRRWIGVTAFAATTLHLGLIVLWRLPYFWAQITPWEQLLGLAAWLVMLPPALTSLDRAVKALGPTRWHGIQKLSYLAAVLAYLHWAVQTYESPKPATVHFGVLLAVRLLAWGWRRWRPARPVRRTAPQLA